MIYRIGRILRHGRQTRGFTLIESAIVTAVVGIGCVAMLQFLAAGTISNNTGTELTTAVHLANNVRELSLSLELADPTTPTHWGMESGENIATMDDVDDLNGLSISPPIDARRQTLTSYSTWTQQVSVQSVDPNRITLNTANGSTPMSRVTVIISHNGHEVYEMGWLLVQAD